MTKKIIKDKNIKIMNKKKTIKRMRGGMRRLRWGWPRWSRRRSKKKKKELSQAAVINNPLTMEGYKTQSGIKVPNKKNLSFQALWPKYNYAPASAHTNEHALILNNEAPGSISTNVNSNNFHIDLNGSNVSNMPDPMVSPAKSIKEPSELHIGLPEIVLAPETQKLSVKSPPLPETLNPAARSKAEILGNMKFFVHSRVSRPPNLTNAAERRKMREMRRAITRRLRKANPHAYSQDENNKGKVTMSMKRAAFAGGGSLSSAGGSRTLKKKKSKTRKNKNKNKNTRNKKK